MEPYRVFLHLDLLECIPSKGRQRDLVLDFVRLLAREPQTTGDYAHRDESQREQQVKIVGDYAVTYWVDDPVKTVMIVGARHADR
jgi:mRNA-degrading endonuclease RelE of RelBE toxin-antitoxin system